MYCGKNKNPPRGKNRFGTPNQCFLKGRKAGASYKRRFKSVKERCCR